MGCHPDNAPRRSHKICHHLAADDDVLTFEKADAEESFLIIVNVRNEPKAVQIPESWISRETKDEVTSNDFKLETTLTLEPFQYLILK